MLKRAPTLGLAILFCHVILCQVLYPVGANSNLVFDWTNGTSMPRPIFEISASVMHGKIYVAGAEDDKGNLLNTLFVYDPSLDKWNIAAPIPVALDHSALSSYENKL